MITYIAATTKGTPRNSFGGHNFRKLGNIHAHDMAEAKRLAKERYGDHCRVMLYSEWVLLNSPEFAERVRANMQQERRPA